MDLKLCEFEI